MPLSLKIAVSTAAILLLSMMVDLPATVLRLGSLTPGWALLASLLFLATHAANAAKLGVLLPDRRIGSLLVYTLMAQAYALFLPGQIAGEAMKAYRLARDGAAGGGHAAVSAVVLDKITGIVAVLVLTLAGVAAAPGSFGAGLVWAALLGLAGLCAGGAALATDRVGGWVAALASPGRRSAPVWAMANRFLAAWRTMTARPAILLRSLAWGFAAQILAVAGSQALGFGLGIELPFPVWCVVIGGLTVALLAPVTVGGIGLREASLASLLGLLGIPADRAVALGFAILAFQILVGLAGLAADLVTRPDKGGNS